MLVIDATYGEGGGQVLRSALSLATISGKAVLLTGIRAHRSKPGLRPQHLTAVRAAADLCQARLEGASLGSQSLTFEPRAACSAGSYHLDVSDAASGGSAGAVTLVLQTMLLPLALAESPSDVSLIGGTVVPMSPPVPFVEKVYMPTLFEMGLRARLDHRVWGFHPSGEGELVTHIRGETQLRGHDFLERGDLLRVEGVAFASKLPSHIPQRMTNRARSILRDAGVEAHIIPEHVRSPGIGTGLFLCARYEYAQAGFLSLGRLRLPSEAVAEIGCRAFLEHHCTGAAVDPHLADQLVLPFVLAGGGSRASVSRITRHLLTNVWVAQQFGFDNVSIVGELGQVGLLQSEGS